MANNMNFIGGGSFGRQASNIGNSGSAVAHHAVTAVQPLTSEQENFLSKIMEMEGDWADLSRSNLEGPDDTGKNTYFAATAKLNESAMFEYGLKKGERKQSSEKKNIGGDQSIDQDNILMNDDEQFLERFDSRGKKMKLRRGKVSHPHLRHI